MECLFEQLWPENYDFFPQTEFSNQSTEFGDLFESFLASHGAALHDIMALSYDPARLLA